MGETGPPTWWAACAGSPWTSWAPPGPTGPRAEAARSAGSPGSRRGHRLEGGRAKLREAFGPSLVRGRARSIQVEAQDPFGLGEGGARREAAVKPPDHRVGQGVREGAEQG